MADALHIEVSAFPEVDKQLNAVRDGTQLLLAA
jgi:hypothetical protein